MKKSRHQNSNTSPKAKIMKSRDKRTKYQLAKLDNVTFLQIFAFFLLKVVLRELVQLPLSSILEPPLEI